MPRDLFGEVEHPSARVGTRSRYTVPISLAAHAVIIVGILAATILGPAVLPAPATGELILLADAHLPEPPPPHVVAAPATPVTRIDPDAAPVVAPDHIAAEVPVPDDARLNSTSVTGLIPGTADFSTVVGEPPPPPSPPPAVKPVPVGGRIRPPAKTVDVPPIYPPMALAARVEGTVIIEATIDVGGRVQSVRVLRSIPLLDTAALTAVGQWVYTPSLLNGVPVPVIMTVTVTFRLR
jgi:periplasmic protein TonB